jgi:alpha-tubulin suppressor-like RCC1 family protein
MSCDSWVEFMWGLIGVYTGLGLALVALLLYLIPVEAAERQSRKKMPKGRIAKAWYYGCAKRCLIAKKHRVGRALQKYQSFVNLAVHKMKEWDSWPKIGIVLAFYQVVLITPLSYEFRYPPAVVRLVDWLSVINLPVVELFHPECWSSGGTGVSGQSSFLVLLLPLVAAMLFISATIMGFVYGQWAKTHANPGDGRLGYSMIGRPEDNELLPRAIPAEGTAAAWRAGGKVVQVSCGSRHTGAVLADGTMWTWGLGSYGQLGHGDKEQKLVPTQVGAKDGLWGQGEDAEAAAAAWRAGGKVVQVACHDGHTGAVLADGTLWTWGKCSYGQLGHGDKDQKLVPTQVGAKDGLWGQGEDAEAVAAAWRAGGKVVQVACGEGHMGVVLADGTLWVWGTSDYGQLGHGNKADKPVPTQVGAKDGLWGQGEDAEAVAAAWRAGGKVVQVACGYNHTGAVLADGTLWTWGFGRACQLGHGDEEQKLVPTQVGAQDGVARRSVLWLQGEDAEAVAAAWRAGGKVVQVVCGYNHTGAVLADGTLWMWGAGGSGRLGHGDQESKLVPTQVGEKDGLWGQGEEAEVAAAAWRAGGKVAQISCGEYHTGAVLADGTLWTWGSGRSGKLGHGEESQRLIPTRVEQIPHCTSVSCGQQHTAAVVTRSRSGSVYTFGKAGADAGFFRWLTAELSFGAVLFLYCVLPRMASIAAAQFRCDSVEYAFRQGASFGAAQGYYFDCRELWSSSSPSSSRVAVLATTTTGLVAYALCVPAALGTTMYVRGGEWKKKMWQVAKRPDLNELDVSEWAELALDTVEWRELLQRIAL